MLILYCKCRHLLGTGCVAEISNIIKVTRTFETSAAQKIFALCEHKTVATYEIIPAGGGGCLCQLDCCWWKLQTSATTHRLKTS
jgi:hypothetical protein